MDKNKCPNFIRQILLTDRKKESLVCDCMLTFVTKTFQGVTTNFSDIFRNNWTP